MIWDVSGQSKLIERIANELNIKLEARALEHLVDSIGNDSSRIYSELNKLVIYADKDKKKSTSTNHKQLITYEDVQALVHGNATNIFHISNLLLEKNIGGTIKAVDSLLDNGEPALRILAT